MNLVRFKTMMYGCFKDSYDKTTPLVGWVYVVGEAEDDEGWHWRAFTAESWDKVKSLSNEEIWDKYNEAEPIDD